MNHRKQDNPITPPSPERGDTKTSEISNHCVHSIHQVHPAVSIPIPKLIPGNFCAGHFPTKSKKIKKFSNPLTPFLTITYGCLQRTTNHKLLTKLAIFAQVAVIVEAHLFRPLRFVIPALVRNPGCAAVLTRNK